jgi:predicted PhzF superfamily epimerase YddE/YHI9
MTASVPYYHVDAFADGRFSGNQAAVLMLDRWPADEVLLAIGAENMFAETAFVVPDASGEADFELRWCTPTVEVQMCGHATLAAGYALLRELPGRDAVRFRTRHVGQLVVRRAGAGFEVGLPAIATEPHNWPEAVEALGTEPTEARRSPRGFSVFLYDDEAEVRALTPDFKALSRLGPELFIATAPGADTDVVSRVFVPGAGIDEDPVTGAAHAVMAPVWAERLGRCSFTAYQASARGGRLTCRLENERVWLAGDCVMVAEGSYYF